MDKEVEIELDILPTGEIRFNRDVREECRNFLLDVLKNIVDDPIKIQEIKDFLDGANDRELILGDEILCG